VQLHEQQVGEASTGSGGCGSKLKMNKAAPKLSALN
jgi:hypothetical protein